MVLKRSATRPEIGRRFILRPRRRCRPISSDLPPANSRSRKAGETAASSDVSSRDRCRKVARTRTRCLISTNRPSNGWKITRPADIRSKSSISSSSPFQFAGMENAGAIFYNALPCAGRHRHQEQELARAARSRTKRPNCGSANLVHMQMVRRCVDKEVFGHFMPQRL